jgi:hypothetical protein
MFNHQGRPLGQAEKARALGPTEIIFFIKENRPQKKKKAPKVLCTREEKKGKEISFKIFSGRVNRFFFPQ